MLRVVSGTRVVILEYNQTILAIESADCSTDSY